MSYVNKKEAVRNLSNPKDFDVFKNMYLKKYSDAKEKIAKLYSDNQLDELLEYVQAINNISLSVGSAFLKKDTDYVIDKIKKGELSPTDLEALSETLDNVTMELNRL
ncbi:MAG: hypothetical protein K6F81_00810 [Acholeplasmatales bacterium]|nr:hypothetical protein [Acholeplasmatales bacterium]